MTPKSRRLISGLALNEGAGAIGTQVASFAVPLAAVTVFDAGPMAIGALNLLDSVAALLVGLAAGRLIDRIGPSTTVILADVVRCGVVACLAILFVFSPQLWMLYAAMLLLGVASIAHEAGVTTAVMALERRSARELNRVNALLRGSSVISELAGPGLGGVVVALLGFAVGLAVGAAWFALAVVAGFVLLGFRRTSLVAAEIRPVVSEKRHASGLLEGIAFIRADSLLRPLTAASFQFNLFSAMYQAVAIVFAVRVLGLGAAELAVVGVLSGAGALAGSWLSTTRVVAAHPKAAYAAALVLPAVCVVASLAAMYLERSVAMLVVGAAQGSFSASMVVCVVLFNTVRQLRSPVERAGQIAASERVLALAGEIPGAVIGGAVGVTVSLQLPLLVAAVGMAFSAFWVARVAEWPRG